MLIVVAISMGVVVYCGAYLLLLNGKQYWPSGVDSSTGQNLYSVTPQYRIASGWIARALAPAHWLDQRVRADHWATIEHSSGRKWKNPPARNPL